MLGAVPDATATAVGSPAQRYIKSISSVGFAIAVASGKANVWFSWIAVGSRVDAAKTEEVPSYVRDFMFGDGNTKLSGKPMWRDSNRISTDKAPEAPKAAKIEPKLQNSRSVELRLLDFLL